MRQLVLLTMTAVIAAALSDGVAAQDRYPRVIGPTGQPYGPTRAFEEYEKRYGRPWHGLGGIPYDKSKYQNAGSGQHYQFRGHTDLPWNYPIAPPFYQYGYQFGYPWAGGGVVGPPGFVDYGPIYSYLPMAPLVQQAHPFWLGPNPFNNRVLNQARQEEQRRWQGPVIVEPQDRQRPQPPLASTPEARLRSLRDQSQGDEWFRKGEYQHAWSRYRQAISEAKDQAEPHFRLALTLAAMRRFPLAVDEIKRGLALDPDWPQTATTWEALYGPDRVLPKSLMKESVVQWVREDVRDPDRLFLLGVLLHLDGDDRAREFFETAYRLAGRGKHLAAFLEAKPLLPVGGAAADPQQKEDGFAPILQKPAAKAPNPIGEPAVDGPALPNPQQSQQE